ncbi:hypothetical protein OF83DRAFT_489688 [Amylostereum chailletii]|nr:hypothetical protein OF83DRAFT_489688 [Amylostereum chailletii]
MIQRRAEPRQPICSFCMRMQRPVLRKVYEIIMQLAVSLARDHLRDEASSGKVIETWNAVHTLRPRYHDRALQASILTRNAHDIFPPREPRHPSGAYLHNFGSTRKIWFGTSHALQWPFVHVTLYAISWNAR